MSTRPHAVFVVSPRRAVVIALALVACGHGFYNPGGTWKPPAGEYDGAGTFVMNRQSSLGSLEREILHLLKRPAGDECAMVFSSSCPYGPPAPTDPPRLVCTEKFLVKTAAPEPQRGFMLPFCGERIDDLLKISWGRDVPRISIRQADVVIEWREGSFREANVEAAIQKLTSGKDRPGQVILRAECVDQVAPTLRAIAHLSEAKMSVVLTMFRHVPDNSCGDPEERRLE